MDLATAAQKHWDLIVVGTGMGGATFGWAMARAGRSVLFLEQGRNLLDGGRLAGDYAEMLGPSSGLDRREWLQAAGRWTEAVSDRSRRKVRRFVPFVGGGTGGSTGLYGAALERLFPGDFEPGRFHGRNAGNLPERWPLDYEEFEPWYREAETLYGVAGGADPLRTGMEPDGAAGPSMDEVNRRLAARLEENGRHPYRLPVACRRGDECRECQGFLCGDRSKRDSAEVCLRPAVEEHGAVLAEGCRVERLLARRRKVEALLCRDASGEALVRGETVVLAAGALQTPALLLRSASSDWPEGLANGSGQVGRNLMRHAIDLYLVRPPFPVGRYRKQLAYNDHYFTSEGKLGSVQSFGMLPPVRMVVEELGEDLAHLLPWLRAVMPAVRAGVGPVVKRMLAGKAVFAGILEDLPHVENRVMPDREGRLTIRYRLGRQDRERLARFRRRIAGDFRPWPVRRLSQAGNNQRIAHACGTCRFGKDPGSSVLDPWNRAHELDNLYVVDASFFPSSGGINPALTIAANALRVADAILEGRGA